MEVVKCRARVAKDCYDGRQISEVYRDEMEMRSEGTFKPGDWTVVCNACYLAIMPMTASGRALTHEIPGGIHNKRAQLLGNQLIQLGLRSRWTEEQFGGVAYAIALVGKQPNKITGDQIEVTQFELDAGDIVAHFGGPVVKITNQGMVTKADS